MDEPAILQIVKVQSSTKWVIHTCRPSCTSPPFLACQFTLCEGVTHILWC